VAQADVGFSIKLEQLLDKHKQKSDCHYEPELFPGLIYRCCQPAKVVLLIFASGKIVLAGAKKRQDIDAVFNTFGPVLYEFRKN
jgi:transcription initiation factor TFIID TATA-box-binding protein